MYCVANIIGVLSVNNLFLCKKIMLRKILLCVGAFLPICAVAQKQQFKVVAIAGYNCENLFDTIDDSTKKDEDFTPTGSYAYTDDVYRQKLQNMASVIQQLGTDMTPDGAAIVGLVEIENGHVLQDLTSQPQLAPRGYKYIWFPTSDERGISTAMLYSPKYFKVLAARPLRVPLETVGAKRPTRDILFVSGILAGDTVHVLVNHWPSKSSGEAATEPYRKLAASVAKNIVDSLIADGSGKKVLLMGDFNDNPDADAIKEVLKTKREEKETKLTDLYNPWENMHRKGMGTENFRGEWHVLDQIIMSGGWLTGNGWKFYKADIFKRDFLLNKIGKDKGLPHRSFTAAGKWDNGYSDHFPVIMYVIGK